jgi:microcystin-dependent protein
MADAYIGEIRLISFNYAPDGWLFCQGQMLLVNQYQALFSLIGTTFGGDGHTYFGLPDLRGRVPVQCGVGPVSYTLYGQLGGTAPSTMDGHALFSISDQSQMPAHSHSATFTPTGGGATVQPTVTLKISNDTATSPTPVPNGYLAALKLGGLGTPPSGYVGTAIAGTTAMNINAATATNGSGGNMTGGLVGIGRAGSFYPSPVVAPISVPVPAVAPPFIALNYIICANSGEYPFRPD